MLPLLATIAGALTSGLPALISYLDRKSRLNHEAKVLELRMQASDKENENAIKLINAEADVREGESLRDHDSSLRGGKFIESLRASVRPVITYFFFILFVAVKGFVVYQAVSADGLIENQIAFLDIYPLLWDDETQAMFGAVIGFWFGSRVQEKLMSSRAR